MDNDECLEKAIKIAIIPAIIMSIVTTVVVFVLVAQYHSERAKERETIHEKAKKGELTQEEIILYSERNRRFK